MKGERIGVNASTMKANAVAARTSAEGDTGEGYRLRCWISWPPESGIETPTAEDLARPDRKRIAKKLSTRTAFPGCDPEAKIA